MKKKEKIDSFVTHWMEELNAGVEFRKKYSTYNNWPSYRQCYRGNWDEQVVPINKIFSFGRMLMPRIYFRAPRVTVTAIHPEFVVHAKVLESVDNMLIKTILLKEIIKAGSLDSYLCGVGPIKLGYDSEFGFNPEQALNDTGETISQFSTKEDNERIEYNSNIKPGLPWANRVRPDDIIVPWGSDDSHELPWIGHCILRPIDDIKQDQKYSNTSELKGTRYPEMLRDRKGASFKPRRNENKGTVYGELIEVRDVKTKQVMVFSENKLLLSAPDELQTDEGLPWEFIVFNPDPEFFWAIPDAHILMPHQEEINECLTQDSQHRRLAMLKFLYKIGAFKPEELEKFLSGEIGMAAGVNADIENLAAAILPLQTHVPPDFWREITSHIGAMREELGASQNQEGSFSPYHGKTASESMIVAESFGQRVDERRDIVADVIVRIVRKWNQMIFKFWNDEKIIQMVGPEGALDWVQFTGDQLKGDYLLGVDVESSIPITRALKHDMSLELMKVFGGDELIDQQLLRQIALDNYEVVDPRVSQLLQPSFAGASQILSQMRQPSPALPGAGGGSAPTAGSGRGSGGGRTPTTPQRPQAFEAFKKKVEGR